MGQLNRCEWPFGSASAIALAVDTHAFLLWQTLGREFAPNI